MSEPMIKQTYPETVAFLGMSGAYSEMGTGFDRVYDWIAESGFTPAGMPAAVYITMPGETSEADNRYEVWAPIADGPGPSGPNAEGLGVRVVDPMTVVSAMHVGPYKTLCETYDAIMAWVAAHDYEPAGPPIEIYYSDPDEVPPEEYLTEVQLPVSRT